MERDWIETLRPLTNAGWDLVDGKLEPTASKIHTDLNWVFANVDFDCTKWNRLYHDVVTKQTLIHSHCHDCIKIVAKPKTLHDLVAIETIQQSMLYPCKCGIDMRDNTMATYGAFWYNRGFPEARMRFKEIRKRMDNEGLEDVAMIIKRGCTEFEDRLGASNKWEPPTDAQLADEKAFDAKIRYTPMPPNNIPQLVIDHTHQRWVKWAFQMGDLTYLEFTNGEKIYEDLVTYDPEDENDLPQPETGTVRSDEQDRVFKGIS